MFSSFSNSFKLGSYYQMQPIGPIEPVAGYTQFTYTITGTDFTGTAGQYPIHFNPLAVAHSSGTTRGNITNFTKANAQNLNFTFYIKGAFKSTSPASHRMFSFYRGVNDGNNNVALAFGITSGANRLLYTSNSESVGHSLFTPIDPAIPLTNRNDYIHTFIRYNKDTSTSSWYFYSINGTLLFNSDELPYNPLTFMNLITTFQFAKHMAVTGTNNVLIGDAGWYDSVLDTTKMIQVVNQNPN